MSAGRIAALASALAAGALAQVAPCLDPADYNGTATIPDMGDVLCSNFVQAFLAFTPDTTTCFEDVDLGGTALARATWLANMAPCCGSGPTACAPYVFNPCANASAFDAAAISGGYPCGPSAVFFGAAFEASAQTCDAVIDDGSGGQTARKMITASLAGACCDDGEDACAAFAMNPCANPASFDGTAQVMNQTCSAMRGMLGAPFTPSAQACDQHIPDGDGGTVPRKMMTGMLGAACCGAGGDVCAQYSGNPCATPASFRPDNSFDGNTCGMQVAFMPTFTPSAATCLEQVTLGESTMVRSAAVAQAAASCCTDGVSVCAQHLMNPCATPASFDGTAQVPGPGQPCSVMQTMLGAFTPSAQACEQPIPDGEGGAVQRKMMTGMLGAACCGAGGDVCAQHRVNPCATPASFRPDNSFDGNTCGMAISVMPMFTPSAATCLEEVTLGENATVRSAALAQAAASCCTDGVSSCAQHIFNPCENPTHFDPAATFDWNSMGVNCGLAAAAIPRFTVSAATCAEEITVPGESEQLARSALASRLSSCCGSNPVVCQGATANSTTTEAATTTQADSVSGASSVARGAGALLAIVLSRML